MHVLLVLLRRSARHARIVCRVLLDFRVLENGAETEATVFELVGRWKDDCNGCTGTAK